MADFTLLQRFAQWSKYLTYIIILLALAVLVGWEFDIEFLKRPLHLKAMNPTSAVCFLSFGLSFCLLSIASPTRLKSGIAYALLFFVLFVAIAKVLALAGATSFQVDTLFFADKIYNDTRDGYINIMPFNTALNFLMLSVALALTFRPGTKNKSIANFLALALLILSLFSIIVYLYRVSEFLETISYFTMAIHTAFGFVLAALTILFINAKEGFVGVISNSGAGGTIARLLLPAAIIAPITIGFLRLIFFQWYYELSVELGVSVLITSIILIFFSLVFFVSNIIVKKDAQRLEAEQKLIEFNKDLEQTLKERTSEILKKENRFRALIENTTDAILLTDKNLNLLYESPAVERMTGLTQKERSEGQYTYEEDLPIMQKTLVESMGNPGKPIPYSIRFIHKNGNPVWIEGVVTNLLDDEGVNALVFNYRDINDRKEAQEKIIANEQRLQSLVENSSDGITLVNETLQVLYQSPTSERLTGYTLEERKNIHPRDLIHPDEIEMLIQMQRQALENPNTPIPFAYRLKQKKGTYIWLEGVAKNLLHDKNINAIVTNYRDITERKLQEEKIAASEQRFRILIENNIGVVSLADKNLKVIYQSPQAEKITGYTLQERAAIDAKDILHPDDVATLMAEYPTLFTNPEKSLFFHFRFKHKLGHYIWLEGALKNMLDNPNIQAIVVNYHDVTERKVQEEKIAASEQRFRTLIENNFDCILLTTDNSELLYQSPSVERVTGFASIQKGSEFYNIHPSDIENAKFLHRRLRENPGMPIRFQLRFMRKNGAYMWAEGVSTNFLQDSRINAIVTNFRDVTDQKLSEAEILKLNAELEERVQKRTSELQAANKELESFSYSVSHDLRAPLRIINGFSQILIDDYYEKIDASGQQVIDRIVRNARKMGQLIDDLLSFSRLGRAEMRLSMIDMSSLVQEVLSDIEVSGILIPANLKVGELKSCCCDSPLIKQVWVNLISNAIKYSSAKENPIIEIGMTSDSRPTYFIKDNGAGFNMNYVHKLFGVFQRLHKAEEFEGTGVGLAIVQRIILRHGGEVWAEAKENEGATFFFYIPE